MDKRATLAAAVYYWSGDTSCYNNKLQPQDSESAAEEAENSQGILEQL